MECLAAGVGPCSLGILFEHLVEGGHDLIVRQWGLILCSLLGK